MIGPLAQWFSTFSDSSDNKRAVSFLGIDWYSYLLHIIQHKEWPTNLIITGTFKQVYLQFKIP
jgi:hypothetical protein